MQVIADVAGRPIERVHAPRLAGAVGAALVAAVGTGALESIESIRALVRVERTFRPRTEHRGTYDQMLEAFRSLHPALSRASHLVGTR